MSANVPGVSRPEKSFSDNVKAVISAVKGTTGWIASLGATGLVPTAQLGTGTANSGTYLRGDQTWAAAGGGAGNSVTVTVDFGSSFSHFATTTVTGQSWVASGSEIVATVLSASGKGSEDAALSFSASVSDLVAGTGFTLNVYAPYKAKGTYTFSCVGV